MPIQTQFGNGDPRFIVLCFGYGAVKEEDGEKKGKKCNMDTLRWYTRIKDTRKTEKRLFSVGNGKRGKRQYVGFMLRI